MSSRRLSVLVAPVKLFLLFFLLGFCCSEVIAQSTTVGSMIGTVTDSTSAPVPGTKITLTSPALQVPSLTTTSDGEGKYKFLDLPSPGVYKIQFEHDGFQTYVRTDVHLGLGFNARLDAPLVIGTTSETIEVVGRNPVIDTQSVAGTTTLQQEEIRTLPRGKGLLDLLPLASGVSLLGKPDVGDSNLASDQDIITYGVIMYPSLELEGINITSDHFYTTSVYFDAFSLAESEFKTTGNTAEVATAGVNMVSVMKSGGNDFHGGAEGSYENSAFQSNNITQELRSQGLGFTNPLDHYADGSADLGGRILRDKLWFYGGWSKQTVTQGLTGFVSGPNSAGCYLCADAPAAFQTTSLSQFNLKGTYQLNPATKVISAWQHSQKYVSAGAGATTRPLQSTYIQHAPANMWKVEVQNAPNEHLLINLVGGYGGYTARFTDHPGTDVVGNPASVEASTGLSLGAYPTPYTQPNYSYQVRGLATYIPSHPFAGGTHEFTIGSFEQWQAKDTAYRENAYGDYQLNFLNGAPTTIQTYNMPLDSINKQTNQSLFATDQWKMKRLVLSLGVRYERYHAYYPTQSKSQGQFSAASTSQGADVATWNDVVPRVGATWDITGSGKSVLKGSFGMFGDTFGAATAGNFNPVSLVTTTYKWAGPCAVTSYINNSYLNTSCDYTPGSVDMSTGSAAYISASGGSNLVVNPDLKQDKTYEYTVKFEHELAPNMSLNFTYVYHLITNRFFTLESTSNPPAASGSIAGAYYQLSVSRPYTAWSIPVTQKDALTGAQVTIYTYPTSYAGAAFNKVTYANAPSDRSDNYHTFLVEFTKRYSRRWNSLVSFWATKNHEWIQAISNSPNDDRFPIDNTWNWEGRANVMYRFPLNFDGSLVYRVQSGFPGQRTEVFGSIPQVSTVTLRMEPYGAERGPVVGLLNARLSKNFHLGGSRNLEVFGQAFNLLNSSPATTTSYLTGGTFGHATAVLSPRVGRIGAEFHF